METLYEKFVEAGIETDPGKEISLPCGCTAGAREQYALGKYNPGREFTYCSFHKEALAALPPESKDCHTLMVS